MKKINLSITGCMGRMGKHLIKSSQKDNRFKLVSLTENKIIEKKISGIKIEQNTTKAFEKSDLIIDFTIPSCTLDLLKIFNQTVL
jgi:4-hydroxy-tetrahydrodipicolinate reductase